MFLFFMLITIATFNANGLRNDIKRKCIFKYLLDCNFHITLLQEAHLNSSIEHIWRNEWPGYSASSHGSSSSKGVAVLLNPAFKGRFINRGINESGRFLFSEIKIENSIFSVANVYGPNQDDLCFFQEFFQKLSAFSAKDLIIVVDFNLILNNTLDKIGGPKHKNAQARNSMISHMNILKLKDVFRLKYPLAKSFTRIQINPFTATTLDFFSRIITFKQFMRSRNKSKKCKIRSQNLYYCYRRCPSSTRTWFLETYHSTLLRPYLCTLY